MTCTPQQLSRAKRYREQNAEKRKAYNSSPEVLERKRELAKRYREEIKRNPERLAQQKSRRAKYWAENKERQLEQRYDKRRQDPRRELINSIRSRARARGLEFDIDVDDIVIPDRCPILGIPLSVGIGTRTDSSPSVDRINNDRGYVKGNVQVISFRANRIKNDASLEEMQKIVEYLKEINQ